MRAERWDARTAEGWGHLADGAGAIVNLAGANLASECFLPSRWTDERRRVVRDSRVDAGRAVVQAVEQAKRKPGVVVQASGVGYYGPCGEEIITEDAPSGHGFLAQFAAEDWEPSTGEVASVLLEGQRAVPRRLLGLGFEFRFPTAEAALKDLLR